MQFPALVVVRLAGVRLRCRCSGQWLFQFIPRLREGTERDSDLACKRGEGNPAYPDCVCSNRWRRGCGCDLHTVVPDVPGAELHVELVFVPLRLKDQPLDSGLACGALVSRSWLPRSGGPLLEVFVL